MRVLSVLLVTLSATLIAQGLENGLARTPPMGWMSWQRFRCVTDCKNFPDECISEKLFMDMANVMSAEGYGAAGYEYIIIDDCWLARERDENGKLQPDPERFPSGIKALADYVHNKGLKFGIYEDYGTNTCAGYPGILGHLEIDAQTFADWGVDYIKVDGCYAELSTMEQGYKEFGQYMNNTGRPIVYSCSWPAYEEGSGKPSNYTYLSEVCNLWRNYGDIEDSWSSVISILNFYVKNQDRFGPFAGPGHWNDPDMLLLGNFGLSIEQSKSQMALWSILASPLLMSVDLRVIRPEFKAILTNRDVIAINQDPMGVQGRRISTKDNVDIFTKPIVPIINKNTSFAIGVLNKRTDGMPRLVEITLKDIGLDNEAGYTVQNVYDLNIPVTVKPSEKITVKVNPTGIVLLTAKVIGA